MAEKDRKDERKPGEALADVEHDSKILGEYREMYDVDVPQMIYDALQQQLERRNREPVESDIIEMAMEE